MKASVFLTFLCMSFSNATNAGTWVPLATPSNGCVGEIRVVREIPNGDMLVGGTFQSCGGVAAKNVAIWHRSTDTWSSLGSGANNGVNGRVTTLLWTGGSVYVGGTFTAAGSAVVKNIARWNGYGWEGLAGGTSGSVYALAESNGSIYAGGSFTQIGSASVQNIAIWNEVLGDWLPIAGAGSGTNGAVYTLKSVGATLYVGGGFSRVRTSGSWMVADRVAVWSGNWTPMGSITNGYVQSIDTDGSTLYACGTFLVADGLQAKYIAQWNGSQWTQVGTGLSYYCNTVHVAAGIVHVGGSFNYAGGNLVHRIAKWDGATWSGYVVNGVIGVNSEVFGIAGHPSTPVVAGRFTQAGPVAAASIARWTEPSNGSTN